MKRRSITALKQGRGSYRRLKDGFARNDADRKEAREKKMTYDEKKVAAQEALDAFRKSLDARGFPVLKDFLLDDELSSRSPHRGIAIESEEYETFKAAHARTPTAPPDPYPDIDPLFT